MSDSQYISSDEFLTRAEIVKSKNTRPVSSCDKYANDNGGKLFVGPMENQYQVKYFFDKLNQHGVIVECEDNPTQKNYAPTIKLTFEQRPKDILLAMSWICAKKLDEFNYIDEKTCILWWD